MAPTMIEKRQTVLSKALAKTLLPEFSFEQICNYVAYLKKVTDKYDRGWLDDAGEKTRISKAEINSTLFFFAEKKWSKQTGKPAYLKGLRPLRERSRLDYANHLAGKETLYYTSNLRYGVALLMFDFDWKSEHIEKFGTNSDAVNAAQYVADELGLLPCQRYIEPSLNGFGASLFILSEIEDASNLDEYSSLLEKAITNLIEKEGFLCTFDKVCGTPGTYGKGTIEKCGTLARLPRPKSSAEMVKLLGLKTTSLEEITSSLPSTESVNLETPSAKPTTPLPLSQVYKGGTFNVSDKFSQVVAPSLPHERMNIATCNLYRLLRRTASVEEILEHYESLGFATGARTQERIQRANDSKSYWDINFIFHAVKKNAYEYLPLIQSKITPAQVAEAYKARPMTLEDVAVFYFLVRQVVKPSEAGAVPKEFLLKGSRKLKANGQTTRTLDNKKIAAIKRLLVKAKLIKIIRKGSNQTGACIIQVV